VCGALSRARAPTSRSSISSNLADAVETASDRRGRRGGARSPIKADVGKAKAGEKIVGAATVGKFGRLDILVNNAGEQHPAEDIRDISAAQLAAVHSQTNIFGMFYLVQAALPHLKNGRGDRQLHQRHHVSGVSAGLLDYSATKGAITAFTRSLSENLVGKGIRVNAVAPGPIWTPLNPRGGAPVEEGPRPSARGTPMKRPGEPNEVAPCFLFLACDDSSYMSGQVSASQWRHDR
jgi:NAD(P)-dependent dehydrogenase (short-subunit alcohol dehydrogenase family)